MPTATSPEMGFNSLGLDPVILAVLEKRGFTVPTPIQAQAIPLSLTGQDIIGIAQTGTGKTMAFALPTLQQMLNGRQQGLVLVPTRELALQVEENIRMIAISLQPSIRTVCLIGGMPIYRQIRDLKTNPRFIIATPGRLVDHLEQGTIKLDQVKFLILDEADRMFDMGFAPQIKRVLAHVPSERQTLLYSATMSPEVTSLAAQYLRSPVRVEVAPAGTAARDVSQELWYVHQAGKVDVLQKLLAAHEGTVLIFTRTKHGAAKLTVQLRALGYTAAEIHSNRSLGQRRQALDGFKQGTYRILVATDIAARGIDVKGIALVVNHDLPDAPEDYVHRIGRTGRAGSSGHAVSLATLDQQKDVRGIERILGRTLPLNEASAAAPQSDTRAYSSSSRRDRFSPSSSRPSTGSRSGGSSFSSASRRPNRQKRFIQGQFPGFSSSES